jgi:hypothetical protein
MSQWDTYPCSVRDCSKAGECQGSGIYGMDGNTYAITDGMPAFPAAEMKTAIVVNCQLSQDIYQNFYLHVWLIIYR